MVALSHCFVHSMAPAVLPATTGFPSFAMRVLGNWTMLFFVVGCCARGTYAHPVYAGGKDNGVHILSHANTDFRAVDGAPPGGKVRTYQDFEAHGDLDAKAALTHQGVPVATIDDLADLATKVAALEANVTAEKAKVAALESTAPPACATGGTRSITYSATTAGWVCNCMPGWTGAECATNSGGSFKAFADLTELKAAVMACSGEDPTYQSCPRTEEVYGLFGDWDVSAVTDMTLLFRDLTYFNGNVSKWDTSSVTRMWSSFHLALSFNQDISGWNVRKVTDMAYMFAKTGAFWQDISAWTFDVDLISVDRNSIWWGSYLKANYAACSDSSPPSCTKGIQ